MSCQLKNKKFTLKSNTLNKNREKEGISKKLNEVASMFDNKLMEVKKRDLEEIKHTTVRKKLETIERMFKEILASNKITTSKSIAQYKTNLEKYREDYVENKRYKKYYAVNVVAKELFIEMGDMENSARKTITKRDLGSHEDACEEAIKFISRKIAEGYKRPYNYKEYKINSSKATANKTVQNKKEASPNNIKGENEQKEEASNEDTNKTEEEKESNKESNDEDTDLISSELDDNDIEQVLSEYGSDLKSPYEQKP